jgi:hypothetical protein
MTTEKKVNPSSAASAFPNRDSEVPTHSAVVHPNETATSGVQKVANRMAHKANKREKEFDRDKSDLFTK